MTDTGKGISASAADDQAIGRREAQRQWEANPCAADTVLGHDPESLEWFREARRIRYQEYAPWLIPTTGIDAIRGKHVLEIGVGVGSDHYTLASRGNMMTALDLSREHLRLTSRHLELEGLCTKTVHGDMEKMPFPDNHFDVVYSFGVLHHTDHMDAAVSEIRRVLRPNGVAIIAVYNRDSLFFFIRTLLYNGIFKGGLIKHGWKRTLARIESGAGDSYVPTVNVLTRWSLRRLFAGFTSYEASVRHVQADDFLHLQRLVRRAKRETLEKHLGFLGWYIVAKAGK